MFIMKFLQVTMFAVLFCYFGGTGVWTQGLTLARQVLCLLNHCANPFLCWVFFMIMSCKLFVLAGFAFSDENKMVNIVYQM
jgi:hypothetical protein